MRAALALPILALTMLPLASNAADYTPFDPARIGLPALTDQGIDYLLEQHKRLINEARAEIASLQASDLSNRDEVIARYEKTISEELRQIARLAGQRTAQAKTMAQSGQAAELPALQALLTTVLQASRFNQLMGNEAEALTQWHDAVEIATTYASNFREKCYEQAFAQDFALGLNRQQALLGTGVDVEPCAKRRYSFEPPGFRFQNCSLWGDGEWELERNDRYPGKGSATLTMNGSRTQAEGEYQLEWAGGGVTGNESGTMRVYVTESRSPDGKVSRTYMLYQSFDSLTARGGQAQAIVDNEPAKRWPLTVSETPCRTPAG